jgi:hypothetical protein
MVVPWLLHGGRRPSDPLIGAHTALDAPVPDLAVRSPGAVVFSKDRRLWWLDGARELRITRSS